MDGMRKTGLVAGLNCPATQTLMRSIAHTMWEHQQHLLAHPDPTDEWWFLVDPSAEPPKVEPW